MPYDGYLLTGSVSEHSCNFSTSALNVVPAEDGYPHDESIMLFEISPWKFPAGQLHPKLSLSVRSNRGVQRACPTIPNENREFSALLDSLEESRRIKKGRLVVPEELSDS